MKYAGLGLAATFALFGPACSAADDPPPAPADPETYAGGYHTVHAHYTHLDGVARAHPDLARVMTYGQSYNKSRGAGGYDLKAICITKLHEGDCVLAPPSPSSAPATPSGKARFLLYTQIHAREITTGEVAWRWIDDLVDHYGVDDAVTSLLDTEEIWVVPIANPDGAEIVQQGGDSPRMQRKNAGASDETRKVCDIPNYGVDLNRNFGSHWRASPAAKACDETYPGPSADSEVETQASEALWRNLFPAVRGPRPDDASPSTAKGIMLTLHSDSNTVMFPWFYSKSTHTANDATQRAIAREMGRITGYAVGQSGEVLTEAEGTTDDWIYENLGTSVFTIEVGDPSPSRRCAGFFPPYACQSDFFWPMMRRVLLYLAPKAAAPFAP